MSYNNRSGGEQVVDIVDVDIMDLTVEDIEQVVPVSGRQVPCWRDAIS